MAHMTIKRHILTQALRVAAVQYAIDAETNKPQQRIADCFKEQAKKANALADILDEIGGTPITIED